MRGVITDPAAPGGLRQATDLPEPRPALDELVLDVGAYAVNRGELALLQQRPDGWRPGQDVAGTVARAAADGSGPPAGAHAVAVVDGGGWSEASPRRRAGRRRCPTPCRSGRRAALPIAGLTALRALRAADDLLGRQVLVTGATGGVGQFAVQLAVAAGADVTALVSSMERAEVARGLGAGAVVDDLERDGLGPFALVLDGIGGRVLSQAVHLLAPGATAVTYGTLGGGPSPPVGLRRRARSQGAGPLLRRAGGHPGRGPRDPRPPGGRRPAASAARRRPRLGAHPGGARSAARAAHPRQGRPHALTPSGAGHERGRGGLAGAGGRGPASWDAGWIDRSGVWSQSAAARHSQTGGSTGSPWASKGPSRRNAASTPARGRGAGRSAATTQLGGPRRALLAPEHGAEALAGDGRERQRDQDRPAVLAEVGALDPSKATTGSGAVSRARATSGPTGEAAQDDDAGVVRVRRARQRGQPQLAVELDARSRARPR